MEGIYRCLCSITIRTMEKLDKMHILKIQESINTDPNKECIRLLTLWKSGAVNWVANNTNKVCMLWRRPLQKSILTVLELINSTDPVYIIRLERFSNQFTFFSFLSFKINTYWLIAVVNILPFEAMNYISKPLQRFPSIFDINRYMFVYSMNCNPHAIFLCVLRILRRNKDLKFFLYFKIN